MGTCFPRLCICLDVIHAPLELAADELRCSSAVYDKKGVKQVFLPGGTYVPWDTSMVRWFQNIASNSIGIGATVGITILAMILGIGVVIMIVKRFSRG